MAAAAETPTISTIPHGVTPPGGLFIALARRIDSYPQVSKPRTTPLPGVCVG
jgi:hypothetical protein